MGTVTYVYPFAKKVLIQKIKETTVPNDIIGRTMYTYTGKVKDRVFYRTMHNGRFTVITYPDLMPSFLTIIKKAYIYLSPACLEGIIVGKGEETIVHYNVRKPAYIYLIDSLMICLLFVLFNVGVHLGTVRAVLGALAELVLIFACVFSMAWIPKSEQEALLKFAEDLGGKRVVYQPNTVGRGFKRMRYCTEYSIDDCIGLFSRKNIYDVMEYDFKKLDENSFKIIIHQYTKPHWGSEGDVCYNITFSRQDKTVICLEFVSKNSIFSLPGKWDKWMDEFMAQKLDAVRVGVNV